MNHLAVAQYSIPLLALARLAFWLTIVLMPTRYRLVLQGRSIGNIYGDFTDFLVFASDITLVLTLLFWITYKLVTRDRFAKGPAFIRMSLLALILVGGLSIVSSIDLTLSIYHTLRLGLLTGFSYYVFDQVRSPEELMAPVTIQIGLQAAVGVGQFLRQSDVGLQALGEYVLDPAWPGISIVASEGQRWLRAYGLSDHPNILGGSLAFGLLLMLGVSMTGEKNPRWYTAPTFMLGSLCLLLTFSRSAWVAFAVGAMFLAWRGLSHNRRPMITRGSHLIMGMLILLAPFFLSYGGLVLTRLPLVGGAETVPSEQQSIGERALLNEVTAQIFVGNPVLGVGIGTLPQAIRQARPDFLTDYQPAHLVLLDAAAETGLPGATIYAILLAAPWVVFARRKELRRSPAMWTVSAALLATLIVGMFDYYTWLLTPGRLWQYLIWGLWAASYRAVLVRSTVGKVTACL